MVSSSTCLISIEPPAWSPSVHRLWRQVHGARREAFRSTMQLTVQPYHITRPLQNKVRRFYYVCKFYVASRAFAQQPFLTYEHETHIVALISPLRALHCRCHIHYSWRNRHPTSHFCTVLCRMSVMEPVSREMRKVGHGPLQSNYATDMNKYTLEGNNNTINTRINMMRSNHTSIYA
jgi:hypothetical protein